MICIYKIQSRIKPKRCYIGSASNFKKRKTLHLYKLKCNQHHSKKLQNHYNKYGKDDLVFTVLTSCNDNELLIYEQFFIDSLKPWFNVLYTAGSSKGHKIGPMTNDHKEKIRQGMRGHKNALGHKMSKHVYELATSKLKINKVNFTIGHIPWNKGKTGCYSKNVLDAISIKMKGKKLSEETKERMRHPKNKRLSK